MATAPQPPAPQQQQQQQAQDPQTSTSSANNNNSAITELNNMQAMFALVLITTGRYLRDQQTAGGSGRVHHAFKRQVPPAKDCFNNSLDQLEDQLHLAQAVVRRELALLQQDRLKREQAEQAERQRRAAESSMKRDAAKKTEDSVFASTNTDTAKEVQQDSTNLPQTMNKDEPESMTSQRAQSPPPPIETSTAPPRDPLFDETPVTATAAAQDIGFDFDAEFGDSMGEGASHEGNQDVDMGGTASDLNFLAGLEDFAKSDAGNGGGNGSGNGNVTNNHNNNSLDLDMDFPMSDLPDMNATATKTTATATATMTTATAPPVSAPQQQPAVTKPTDLPPATQPQPVNTENDTNTLDADARIDDLEDLFNMDYENPEDTQFNDAFFGFDD